MSSFFEVFQAKRVFLPVVHVVDEAQALRGLAVAFEHGAHGAFLISHRSLPAAGLIAICREARRQHPDFWLGLNFLDLQTASMAFAAVPVEASGLWIDASGIDLRTKDPTSQARHAAEVRRQRKWDGLYFGCVGFKHQPRTGPLVEEVHAAAPFMDVMTTSGDRTGTPPSKAKIQGMRRELEREKPLAIASGITSENVGEYLPYAHAYLVGTSIERENGEFDPAKVRALADRIRAW